jgi:hypothetical protein
MPCVHIGSVMSACYWQENGVPQGTLFTAMNGTVAVVGQCLLTLLYVHYTIYYSFWRTLTVKFWFWITLVFLTGFCRLDCLTLLQTPWAYTPHNSIVYILPKNVPD